MAAGPRASAGAIRCGGLLVDPDAQEAWAGDDRIELLPAEFRTLLFLLENAGRVVSHDELAARVLHTAPTATNTRNQIWEVRRKLSGAGLNLPIMTVRGRGYLLLHRPEHAKPRVGKA
jgi:DNA-binding response OmpR family regulator